MMQRKREKRNKTLEKLVERFEYGDVDCKVSVFAKVLSHCGFEYETVIVRDDTTNALVNAARLCFPD